MSDDDDTGGRKKNFAGIEQAGKKPVTLRLWVVVAIALLAFVAGAWLV